MSLRDYYASLLSNPNVQKALNLISRAEGANHYSLVGQGTNNFGLRQYGFSRHPKELGFRGVYNPRVNDYSTAAGAYQIVYRTWKGLQKRGIVGDSFAPQEQDIAALALIDEKGALQNVLAGDVKGFVSKTSGVWESFQLRSFGQIAQGWGGSSNSNYDYASQSGSIIPASFPLSDSQSALAKKAIPKEWRGLIVLTIAAVVLFAVYTNLK